MKRKMLSSLLAIAAFAVALPASALPVRATFDGTITGGTAFFQNVLNEFPIGTAAFFDVTFDDALLTPSPPSTYTLAGVSGSVRLGTDEWQLDAGRIGSYTYLNEPGFPVQHYGLQMTGTGPGINSSGSLFGLFMRIAPDLSASAIDPFMVGFRFPVPSGEFYGYANLTGNYSINRSNVTVPEPNSLTLLIAALAMLGLGMAARRFRTNS
jgi:hypothetical protein